MLVGNRVPENLRRSLNHHGFEWKELSFSALDSFLNEKKDFDLLNRVISKDPPIHNNHQAKRYPSGYNHQESAAVTTQASPSNESLNTGRRMTKYKEEVDSVQDGDGSFTDVCGPANVRGVAFARRMLRDSLAPIEKSFKEYRITPYGISGVAPSILHFGLENGPGQDSQTIEFRHGNIWWAYRFGFSENLPPNDMPNISVNANTTGLDVTLNAELQPSEKVMLDRIRESRSKFDRLITDHGGLWFKTWKFEHQPRIYHWILSDVKAPGEFDGSSILQIRRNHEKAFNEERDRWIRYIRSMNRELSELQIRHLETHNKRLNLALRLVDSFQKDSPFWSHPFEVKVSEIVAAVERMKPLVDFFVKQF